MIEQDILDRTYEHVVNVWNNRELINPESIEETLHWYTEHLKKNVLEKIYNLNENAT
jgi:hypothetical protein